MRTLLTTWGMTTRRLALAPSGLAGRPRAVVAMIHLEALPGAPAARLSVAAIERRAVAEAKLFRSAGVDGVLIENMHDTPYLRGNAGPETVAAMAVVARAVRNASGLPCGVQVLAGANQAALAIALAAGLDFIRAEAFAFAHIADEGLLQSSAAELLRYRRSIGADRIQIWVDVKKKHSSHAITADLGIGETAAAAEFLRADAVIVTGKVTGEAPPADGVRAVQAATVLPVWIGSGVSASNAGELGKIAQGAIVGSEFKRGGHWTGAVDPRRVEDFLKRWRGR